MPSPGNDAGRLVVQAASQMSCGTLDSPTVPPTTDDPTTARCERCGHPLHAAASIAAGIGPVCRRRRASEVLRVGDAA